MKVFRESRVLSFVFYVPEIDISLFFTMIESSSIILDKKDQTSLKQIVITSLSLFFLVTIKKMLGKSQPQFRETLIKFMLMQSDAFLMKENVYFQNLVKI